MAMKLFILVTATMWSCKKDSMVFVRRTRREAQSLEQNLILHENSEGLLLKTGPSSILIEGLTKDDLDATGVNGSPIQIFSHQDILPK